MKLFKRLWSAITGFESSAPSPINDAFESDATHKRSISEIELVPTDVSDPYQDHTHRPHCSDHFLFTKDCALCQEVTKDHEQSHPEHRSFGFTDSITAASLTPDLKNLGPTPANAALQSLPAMILQIQPVERTIVETIAVKAAVQDVIEAVNNAEIDLLRND